MVDIVGDIPQEGALGTFASGRVFAKKYFMLGNILTHSIDEDLTSQLCFGKENIEYKTPQKQKNKGYDVINCKD